MLYDCTIVGGGIAGLQAAIQLGRYSSHQVLVVDSGYGRSTLCQQYHNILGFPDGISGPELRERGRVQAKLYGVRFIEDKVVKGTRTVDGFQLVGEKGQLYKSRTVLLATGISDRFPNIPGLVDTLGISVYVCPDCDGYEVQNRKTIVMGNGDKGAQMALLLSERTKDLTYVNHESGQVDDSLLTRMKDRNIKYLEGVIEEIRHVSPRYIGEVVLSNGSIMKVERGFIAFGGNKVHSGIAVQLGAEIHDNHHVKCDPRSKQTNVPGLWVAGDLGFHAEQVTVAMGEGAVAAIWIHKALSPCYNQ